MSLYNNSTLESISDPLAIYSDFEDLMESYKYLRYNFFVDYNIDGLAINDTSSSDDKTSKDTLFIFLKNIFSKNIKTPCGFPHIPNALFGLQPSAPNTYGSPNDVFEHCLISCLHSVLYLLYTLDPKQNSNSVATMQRINEQRIIGYFEYSKMKPVSKSGNVEKDSYWNKQFQSAQEKDLAPHYRLFLYGRKHMIGSDAINTRIPSYNMKFFSWLRQNQDRIWDGVRSYAFTSNYSKLKIERYLDIMEKMRTICNTPNPASTKNSQEQKVDNILLQYQCERYFNMHLLDHLFTNLPADAPKEEADLWLAFMSLPNVFSRNKVIDAAIDSFNRKISASATCFEDINKEKLNSYVKRISLTNTFKFPVQNKAHHNYLWVESTCYGILYLRKVVFPFYEKYMFNFLWEYFAKTNHQIQLEDLTKRTSASEKKAVLEHMRDYLFKKCAELDLSFEPYSNSLPESKKLYLDAINVLFNGVELDLNKFFRTSYSPEYFGILVPPQYMGYYSPDYGEVEDYTDFKTTYDFLQEIRSRSILQANGGSKFRFNRKKLLDKISKTELQ